MTDQFPVAQISHGKPLVKEALPQRPFRLLLISPSFVGYGGIEAFVLHLASFLMRQPHVELRVCFKIAGECGQAASLEEAIARQGVPVLWVQRGSRELFRQIAWADLLHVQNAPPDVLLPAWVMRKPIVLTIHNQLLSSRSNHGLLWRLGARLARRRWYNSAFVRSTWEITPPDGRSRCVPTICDLPTKNEAATTGVRRGFVFISRMVDGKGAETLAEAYRLAALDPNKWPLHYVGDGPVRARLERRLTPGIHVHGFVSEEEKSLLLGSARWLVAVPDVPEDMGLTPLEARAIGVPCIVSSVGGLPEVGGAQAFQCPPGNPVALASVLQRAAALSAEDYERISLATQEDLKHFLVPMDFYLKEYRDVLAEAGKLA